MPDSKSIKILFNFFSNVLDDYTTETLLAEVVNQEYGYYKLKSLPFYAPKIALDDTVWAEYKETEGMLVYRKTVQHSGNSTIHVVILNGEYNADAIAAVFKTDGCSTEKLNNKYFAIAVPAAIDYLQVKKKLDELEMAKIVNYVESCLSGKHQYKNIPLM